MRGSTKTLLSSEEETVETISIIIPVYNEEENLPLLEEELFHALEGIAEPAEIIAINDGSSDRSADLLAEIAERHDNFRVVNFRRNHGQTAAMMAGIDHATGDIIITIDSDLQNDPQDIPLLLTKMKEGFDVVSGWRRNRKDAKIRRNMVSRIANKLISSISGVHLHDYGCTLKAYRRDVIEGHRLYGEMHRFIPIYATWMGAKVTELPVRHHPRKYGKSKYGLERTFKVILDLIVIRFLEKYMAKPIYIFGGFGILSVIFSFMCFFLMIYLKVIQGVSFILTPLPVLCAMAFLVGVVSILMGLLAEIMVRTYYESQDRPAYTLGSVINMRPRENVINLMPSDQSP